MGSAVDVEVVDSGPGVKTRSLVMDRGRRIGFLELPNFLKKAFISLNTESWVVKDAFNYISMHPTASSHATLCTVGLSSPSYSFLVYAPDDSNPPHETDELVL